MSDPGSSNRYRTVETVFQRALDVGADGRAAYLDGACAGDAELRREVETLLAHFVAAGDRFLGSPAPELRFGEAGQLPRSIGRYQIARRIGQGGMGVVYEARQENPRRTVAIKVIRPGIVSEEAVRRFGHEAAILGRLQHAGIAHVYEAGVAEVVSAGGLTDRQPFFAMEFVDGEPLSDYVRSRRPEVRGRLALFARICDAVEHAHQKAVIHRDLKPANILVSPAGEPKILDFGVARVTDADVQATTLHTQAARIVGTLPYMSPEQVEGRAELLDTRCDVYALGVILYELLAGRLPYDLADKPLAAAARVILDSPPLRLGEADRGLRGDLETIVHKALEKDPARRYASVQALAADVRHYLCHEPIAARPASRAYQFRMFARRNRGLVVGAGATLAALLAGVVGTTWGMVQMSRERFEAGLQRDAARLQARIAGAVNDFLTLDVLEQANPRNQADRELSLAEVLDRAAERIEGRFADAPLVEAQIRRTIGMAYRSLGRTDAAEVHLVRARDLYRAARGELDEGALLCRMELAGALMDRTAYAEAEREFVELLEIQRQVLGPEHRQTVGSMHNLGVIYAQQGRFAEAGPFLEQTLHVRLRTGGPEDADTAATMMSLGAVYSYTGRQDEAVAMLERALEIHERLGGEEHPEFLRTLANLGATYFRLKRYDEAEAATLRALELNRRVLGEEHRETLRLFNSLAVIYGAQGRMAEREALLREGLERQRRVLGDEHMDTLVTRNTLAKAVYDRGDYAAAEAEYADLAERLSADHPGHWLRGAVLRMRGRSLARLERREEAQAAMLEAHRILAAAFGEEHRETRQAADALADLYEEWDKAELAAPWRARAGGPSATAPSASP